MISTTVDKTVIITAERGTSPEEARRVFGNEYKASHITVSVSFQGEWPTKRDMREELEDCIAELLNAFEAKV